MQLTVMTPLGPAPEPSPKRDKGIAGLRCGATPMWTLDFDQVALVLEAVGMAEARSEPLDLARASGDSEMNPRTVSRICREAEQIGLIVIDTDLPGEPPILTHAGRQYLAQRGRVGDPSLFFLGEVIGDLYAREALMRAGTMLVDEFRTALLGGWIVEHAEELVPRAFRAGVDGRLAVDLFAACVALTARLSSGDAAGCLAEEVVAVELLRLARYLLDEHCEQGGLDAREARAAADALQGLFDLFGDDDVLLMFEMEEPADAALAGHSPVNQRLGRADQRLEAWFEPFTPAAPTGHLTDPT